MSRGLLLLFGRFVNTVMLSVSWHHHVGSVELMKTLLCHIVL
jgi:hypothetical protein